MSSASRSTGTRFPAIALPAVSPGKLAVVGVGVGFLGILVVLPLASLFLYVLGGGLVVFWDSISSPEAVFVLSCTILLAGATAVINGVLGTVVALMLTRHEFPLKGLVDSLVDLPLAVPASVTVFTLIILYGPLSLPGRMFEGAGITIMFAFPGLLVAHVLMTLPFVVRAVTPMLQRLDQGQEEAARTMGADEVRILRSIVLPSIGGGLITGCVLTFTRSLGEFGATIMVSGNLALGTQTAPLYIFSEFNEGNMGAASAMSMVLMLASFALFLGFKLATRYKGPREV